MSIGESDGGVADDACGDVAAEPVSPAAAACMEDDIDEATTGDGVASFHSEDEPRPAPGGQGE